MEALCFLALILLLVSDLGLIAGHFFDGTVLGVVGTARHQQDRGHGNEQCGRLFDLTDRVIWLTCNIELSPSSALINVFKLTPANWLPAPKKFSMTLGLPDS